jgi:hypothetical protein
MIRIVSAEPLVNCRLKVTFNDGVSGIFPVEPERRGGVFLKLLDERVFNAVTVNPDFGCVEWPGGVDLCPDAMHQAMTGSESEAELPAAAALRENAKKNQ